LTLNNYVLGIDSILTFRLSNTDKLMKTVHITLNYNETKKETATIITIHL